MKAALKRNEALLAKNKGRKKKKRLLEKLLLFILMTLSDACHVAASPQIRSRKNSLPRLLNMMLP